MKEPDGLAWVDEFITRVRPYIFVRLEDNLLIKRPNVACKLNATGARILKALLDGTPMHELLCAVGRTPEKAEQVRRFLGAVRAQTEGTLTEFTDNPAVEVRPFEMRFSELPVLSEVALTNRCTVQCQFCYAGCSSAAARGGGNGEMGAEDVKQVLWKLRMQAQVPSVSFTGGEPTLAQDLPAYVRYAKELGMRVNLITNGTIVSQALAAALAESGLDSAQVSIEGVSAATHDALVQAPGAFEKTVAGMRHLRDAGIRTHTNTTITQANLDECAAFPRFAAETLGNERFSMNLMIPAGSGARDAGALVAYSAVGALLETLIAESAARGVEFMWYSPVPMCLFNSVAHGLGNKGCSACDGLVSVAANGDVLPCSSCNDAVGNLLREEFDAIWQSAKARAYREKAFAHPRCKSCADFYICHGACPLYWRQVGFGELECQWPEAAAAACAT